MTDRRRTDATRLSFPLQTVAAIVLGALAVAGGNWASQSGLRSSIALLQSDMRDLITRQTLQAEVAAAAARLQDERAASMKATIEEMKRRLELVQLQYQQLRETMLEDKPRAR